MTAENPLFARLLPARIDNSYRGHKVALWLFGLYVLMKSVISLNSIFNGAMVAGSADGIPLDSYTAAGAQAVVSLFALMGYSGLMFCLLCLVVLIRYRAMVPFMFALLLLESLGRKLILYFLPIATTREPPGSIVSLTLLAVMILGLALSLWSQNNPHAGDDAAA